MHTTERYLADRITASLQLTSSASVQERIERHLEIAVKMAFSMLSKWRFQLPKQEVRSIASVALCEAAARFDDSKGVTFGTFLFSYVRGHLLKELTASYNRKRRFVLENDFERVGPAAENPEDMFVRSELVSLLSQLRQRLTPLENTVLDHCFVDEMSVVDVAREVGFSRGHISRLKKEALSLLSRQFEERLAA
jgi:RNA polymerase sigma factor (sigma-70 family)